MREIYLISHTPNDEVKHLKVCEIEFLKFSIDLKDFDALVVTSKHSIKALKFNNIKFENIKVFSIGDGTTNEAKAFGFTDIYTAKNHHGNEFAREILSLLPNKKVLFLRAKEVVSNVDGILLDNEVDLTSIVAYRNKFIKLSADKIPPKNSILIFTSPSNVKGFLRNFEIDESYSIVSIGKATTNELLEYKNVITSSFQDVKKCIEIAQNLK
ncbi:uroporphyrinogen-III synthase [Campylobacter blaseri]|uniref:Uroporphyrinogen-III synthase n=2 Tax=Campylobacter blaseri TaxID=2042961 RepID=A0A2P8R0S4_9BACT|nr:uroporphyrinogen-III synthase [Campylobacter blaseri]PSM53874.1 uroporphyrinogen-III synthase [Campylobacter blaseri]